MADSPNERRYTIWVCPECGDWADTTANGRPLHTGCAAMEHPDAERVEVMPVPSSPESSQEQKWCLGCAAWVPPDHAHVWMTAGNSPSTQPVEDEAERVMRCPECGRVASVAPWVGRPVCVHAWDSGAPEVWDGDDTDGEGRLIEQSPNEDYRSPGPKTWAGMQPIRPLSTQGLEERVAEALWRDAGFGGIPGEEEFAKRPEWARERYLRQARAALAVLADGAEKG